MPSIYLGKQSGPYSTSSGTVNVAEEDYTPSKLFKKYKHTPASETGKIYIYKGTGIWSGAFIITRGNTHTTAKLKEAHVYFNKFDTKHENPLLFVLIFNGVPTAENKYYTRSQFNGKFSGSHTEDINTLTKYENEQNILDALIAENDSLDNILTYNIGKKQGDENGNGKYNNKKISVQEDSSGEPKLSGKGFNRYKHTPANGGNGDKKACVIYDGNVLLKSDKGELRDIQNQQYESIRVYFGTRAKKTSATNGAEQGLSDTYPLLIELTKTSSSDQPEYYVHKRTDSEYYWEPLQGSGAGNTLKNLLEDMGFGMTQSDNGYQQFKKILQGASVRVSDGEDLSTKVKDITGNKLKNLLSQKVGQQPGDSTGSQKTLLQILLQKIEFDLLDSVVILLDKTNTDRQYGDSEVVGPVAGLVPLKEINTIDMGGSKNISVSDATTSKGQCVKEFGYKLIKHDITEIVKCTLTIAY